MSEYSLAGFIFDRMESEGFHCAGHKGRPGEEVVTFQNEAGETRIVKFGFTPAKPKNFKFKIPDNKKGGENG